MLLNYSWILMLMSFFLFSFFFNDTATTEIYTLSLHDALPISTTHWRDRRLRRDARAGPANGRRARASSTATALRPGGAHPTRTRRRRADRGRLLEQRDRTTPGLDAGDRQVPRPPHPGENRPCRPRCHRPSTPRGYGLRRQRAIYLWIGARPPAGEALAFSPLFEDGDAVLATEAEAVHQHIVDVVLAGFPRHVVQVALGVGGELVDRGRDAACFQGFHRCD